MQTTIQDTQYYMEQVRRYHENRQLRTGRQPVFYSHSYGCQQNVSDGEKINGMLLEMGYSMGESPLESDLVIYNTCAVRENAEDRIFGNVGALKHAKSRNPDMIVALCGCMMQQEHIAQKIKKSFPYVDLVFGTHALKLLPQLLHKKLTEGGRVFETGGGDGEIVEDLPLHRDGSIKAWLPIMYGCNNFCTYCVVPLVRGRERSREPERILAEAGELVRDGYKEITLLGQNVNSYGKTLDNPMSFSELLRELDKIDGDFRIRFMTSHPKDCTRELIDTIAECDHVCNHIHLPVQSGCNRVLKAMNRSYTREGYLELIRYAKERIPGVTFTSDIIVGFPGETYEDFQETLELIREVEYLSLFTFLYSSRVGTRAAEMEDPVPHEEKIRWFQELLETQKEIGRRQYNRYLGETQRVLVEGPGKSGEGYLTGRNESNMIVNFQGSQDLVGTFTDVNLTQALNWAVLGDVVK